jgi:hypothetical protein
MSQQQTEILAFCADALEQTLAFNLTLFSLAKWAFVLAFALAVVSTALDLWVKLQAAKAGGGADAITTKSIAPVTPDLLKAFTSFLEGIAKLPIWFALFLAGMALVWLTTVNVPSVCEPSKPLAENKGADARSNAAPAPKAGEAPKAPVEPETKGK